MTNKRSVLLKTSSGSDVKYSGGNVSITGLPTIKASSVLSAVHVRAKDEVQQVATLGSSWTLAGNTRYPIKIGDPNSTREGFHRQLRVYSFTTPADITILGGTAALQREYIVGQLVNRINADLKNNVTAASLLLGTGMTITDNAGYYPALKGGTSQGRQGANIVLAAQNPDGSGFKTTDVTITTEAIYSFGDGTKMVDDTPVIAPYFAGNLISGRFETPKTITGLSAVAGQKYDAFIITGLTISSIPTVTDIVGFQPTEIAVFVDNGKGGDTTNATGYDTFVRKMNRLVFGQFAGDPNAIVDFFDAYPTFAGSATAAPTGATGAINVVNTGKNSIHYVILGAGSTKIIPVLTATGLQLDMDAADNEGAEYSAPLQTNSPKEFVVGQNECSMYVTVKIATVANTDDCAFGFRKKEAYQANIDDYNDEAILNVQIGDIFIETIKTNAATVSTDTTKNFADGETHALEVRILIDGTAKFFVDGVDVSSVQATPYKFTAGLTIIPFIFELNDAAASPVVTVRELAVVGSAYHTV